MKWSFKLITVAGIPIRMHATFFFLLIWIALANRAQGRAVLSGLLFILTIFACVVLHELGHSLAARMYGIRAKDITLLPIGGVARLERMPEGSGQELVVALAGPAVNVVIALLCLAALVLGGGFLASTELTLTGGSLLFKVMAVNASLVVFNLLPAFPMDGGRVLRALLATRLSYVRATNIAARIGQGMAILFGFLGLLYNPFLLFIALFVYMGAEQEASLATVRSAFRGIPVAAAMTTSFATLAGSDPLTRAMEALLAGHQQDFPVIDSGKVVGILTRGDLLKALAHKGSDAHVGEAMRADFGTVGPGALLDDVFRRMKENRCPALPVVEDGRLKGLLTLENIAEFLMVSSALQESARKP